MTQEQTKKIEELREKIASLNVEINKCEAEINTIMIDGSADFEGSYVEFFDGEEYVFMKVEHQNIRGSGRTINLQGPTLRLDDNPLNEDHDDPDVEGFGYGCYDEADGLSFDAKVFQGLKLECIRKITKEDMTFVLDYYVNTVKKNLL